MIREEDPPMSLERWHLTAKRALARLPSPDGKRFAVVLSHGTLSVEIYAPRGEDPQRPHTRDEVYVIASGRGEFVLEAERRSFGPGDVLFVPAHARHRFERFSDDFSTWVFFYGPEGGEPETAPAGGAGGE
jgi:mannose-6-phosphate isomerase-like protein (cupin superfamily)